MCGEKGVYCTLGWSDFEKYKKLHILCCAKLLKDPNSKISVLYVASFLGRRASENLECYPKMSKKKKKILSKVKPETKFVSFACLKAKTEEKGENIFV